MPVRARPLSPHLQIYSWQISNTLSILHRVTGGALAVGLAALCCWLIALAGGEDSFRTAQQAVASPVGLVLLAGWTFAFTYHLLNGVRHLVWDAGYGFDRTPRRVSGWFVVLGALVLTAGAALLVWHRLQS